MLKRSELAAPSPTIQKRSDRLTGGYLIFVAVRCTLQYVVLPFLLPFLGFSGVWSAGIAAAIDVLALGMIIYNIFNLWNTSWRWRYLALSVVMITILVIFLYQDFKYLFPG
ncbi:MAG: hypothetical protein KIS85_06005 [Anaerolineales bacterium]|nr:hypothetical protein [Anaerolineales bacterium]